MKRPRLGKRGASLLIYATIWVLSGFPMLFENPPSEFRVVALRAWAALFVAAGVVAGLASLRRTPRADRWGFIALMVSGWLWCINCLTLFALSVTTNVVHNGQYLVLQAVTTGLLMVKVGLDAGWSEPTEPVLTRIDQ